MFVTTFLTAAGAGIAAAEDPRREALDVTMSAEYSQGTFGTAHTTRILYAPLVTQWLPTEDLELRLTVPYLWERGHTIFALIGGGIAGTQRAGIHGTRDRAVTVEGLGDVLLEMQYTILDQTAALPEIAPFAQIKAPTADSSRGLGTGAFDETLGVEITKKIVNDWSASVELGYTFVGSPPRQRFDDAFGWLVGVRYDVTKVLGVGAFLEGATAVARHEDDPLEARVEVQYKVAKRLTIVGGAIAGFSNASPAFGVTAGVQYRFW